LSDDSASRLPITRTANHFSADRHAGIFRLRRGRPSITLFSSSGGFTDDPLLISRRVLARLLLLSNRICVSGTEAERPANER
jgi:hypothetical protein